MIKVTGLSSAASNPQTTIPKESAAIPLEDQYKPTETNSTFLSKGQPTIFGNKVVRPNVEELKEELGVNNE